MSRFKHLFSPLEIRGLEIRNRILSTGHQTFLARNGLPSDELIAYHEARAKGGVGLIVIEASRFHESALSDSPELTIHRDDSIPGYRRIADAAFARPADGHAVAAHPIPTLADILRRKP